MLLLIVLSGLIISICMGMRQSLGLFMSPMALGAGVSAATFGFAIALQNIVLGVAQPFVGALADRHGARPVLVGTALLYAAGLVLMASTLVFASAMGFLWLGVAPLVSGIIGRVFGLTHFNTLYGIVFLSHQVGSFFGAWMGGVVFDWRGSYDWAWAALIVIGFSAFTLQWLMDERPPRERRPAGGPAAIPA